MCRSVGDTQKKAVIIASVLGTAMVLAYSLVSFMLLLRYLSYIVGLMVHAVLSNTHTYNSVELSHTLCHAVTWFQALWCHAFGKLAKPPLSLLIAGICLHEQCVIVSHFASQCTSACCFATLCMQL